MMDLGLLRSSKPWCRTTSRRLLPKLRHANSLLENNHLNSPRKLEQRFLTGPNTLHGWVVDLASPLPRQWERIAQAVRAC
jgi:hypothetical protein